MKPKRLTKEQFIERVKDLWTRFYNRVPDITFDEFYSEALKEFQKQNSMTDEELEKYRIKEFKNLINETNKNISQEELDKLEKSNLQTIDEEAIMKYGNK